MKIGIYGGTFDPPHKGHSAAADVAVRELGLDKLFVIPAATPPHKERAENDVPAIKRLELTKEAMKGIEKAVVSDIELLRGGISYSVDTVKALREQFPGDELYLLVGTDMFLCFENWKAFKEILKMVTLAVVSRRGGDNEHIEAHSAYLSRTYEAAVKIIRHDEIEISSSELRDRLSNRDGRTFLSEGVYDMAMKDRLYGANPDFDWLREKAYAMLKPSRIAHVKGCEEEARKLAERWGADVDKAAEAAILHDITKKDSLESQLLICAKYGIILDEMEEKEAKLLHSKTGATIAKHEFGCDDEVFGAIYWHTTGKEDMSLLEKIIYMADYIEPNRSFPGVDELRQLAYKDIDQALKLGFEMSIEDMRERDIIPHVKTLSALEWITDYLKDRDR